MDWTRRQLPPRARSALLPRGAMASLWTIPPPFTSSLHCHKKEIGFMKCRFVLLLLVLSLGVTVAAAETFHPVGNDFDRTIDRITAREAENVKVFAKYSPIVETYIQGFRKDKELGRVPVEDQYFLGRASFKSRLQDDSF